MIDISREVLAIEPWDECASFFATEATVTFRARRHDRDDAQELMTYTVAALLLACSPALWLAQHSITILPWFLWGWIVCAWFFWIPSRPVSVTIGPERRYALRRPAYFYGSNASSGDGALLVRGRVTFKPALAMRAPVHVLGLWQPEAFFFALACSPDKSRIDSLVRSLGTDVAIPEEEFECSGVSRRSGAAILSRILFRAVHNHEKVIRDGRLHPTLVAALGGFSSKS